jgi:hypothetical protein
MQDFVNLVMLVCAAIASMGLGVIVAYGLFKGGFSLMRWHAHIDVPEQQAAVKTSSQVARVS